MNLVKTAVLFGKKNKPRERFYLLPGQGGRNFRKKQNVFLMWAVIVAVSLGAVLAVLQWWFSKPRH